MRRSSTRCGGGVQTCWHHLNGSHFTLQTDDQSLMHLTRSSQDLDNGRVGGRAGRLMWHAFTFKCIKGITNVVTDAPSRRPTSSPTCADTAQVCDDCSFPPEVYSNCGRDTDAVTILAKLKTGKHSIEDNLLWLATDHGFRQLYFPYSF